MCCGIGAIVLFAWNAFPLGSAWRVHLSQAFVPTPPFRRSWLPSLLCFIFLRALSRQNAQLTLSHRFHICKAVYLLKCMGIPQIDTMELLQSFADMCGAVKNSSPEVHNPSWWFASLTESKQTLGGLQSTRFFTFLCLLLVIPLFTMVPWHCAECNLVS